jgi:hypothetical protein
MPAALCDVALCARPPQPGVTTTLDGLRAGDVGELIPRTAISSSDLYSNAFLP